MIYKLTPKIVRKIWGGKKLEKLKSFESSDKNAEPIGETLEIFHDPETQNPLSYLVKFIDTSEALSIQVHPGDEYARLHENSSGKTECWLILEADEGAGIYLGLKSGVTEAQLRLWLEEKRAIDQLLNFYTVNAGDFFYVPAGTIHAIGKNVLMAEIQQNSGITYRVWDWNRDRELHVKKSLDVINFEPEKNTSEFFKKRQNVFQIKGLEQIVSHSDFKSEIVNMSLGEKIKYQSNNPFSILNLNGKIVLKETVVMPFQAIFVKEENIIEINAIESGSFLVIKS